MKPIVEVRLWHGANTVRLPALVDSGADLTLLDVQYAYAVGLDRSDAEEQDAMTAGGTALVTLRWPKAPLELQFERDRFAFAGAFAEFPDPADGMNLLGRGDFFQRYTVQFWDAAELLCIDTSPDFAKPAVRARKSTAKRTRR